MRRETVTVTLPLTQLEKAENADMLVDYRSVIGMEKMKLDTQKEIIKALEGRMETVMVELDSGNRNHEMDLYPRKNFIYTPPRKEWVDDNEKVWKSRELSDNEMQTTTEDCVITEEGEEEKPQLKKAQ